MADEEAREIADENAMEKPETQAKKVLKESATNDARMEAAENAKRML